MHSGFLKLWHKISESGNRFYSDPSEKRRNVVVNKTLFMFLIILVYMLGFALVHLLTAGPGVLSRNSTTLIYPASILVGILVLGLLATVRIKVESLRLRTLSTVLVFFSGVLYITIFSAFLGREVGFWLFLLMLVPAPFVLFPYRNKLGIVVCECGLLAGLVCALWMQAVYSEGLVPLPPKIVTRLYYQKFFVFFIGLLFSSFFLWKQTALTETTLLQLSATDNLTGILNRRRMMEIVDIEFEKTRRYGRPLSLIIFDLDYFKRINDDFGHAAGDEVLRVVASLVQTHIRHSDFLARWGGEEFLILLTEADRDAAASTAVKIKALLEEQAYPFNRQVTASFGVTFVRPEDKFDRSLERADRALYEAKRSGRNRIVVA